MTFDYSLAGLVSLSLLFYLTYALLRPERFRHAMFMLGQLLVADALLTILLVAVLVLLLRSKSPRKV